MHEIKALQRLAATFDQRGPTHHAGDYGIHRIATGAIDKWLVLDLTASRAILTSPDFISLNYYQYGFDRQRRAGRPLPHAEQFFQQCPIFLEGDAHSRIKKQFRELVREQAAMISSRETQLLAYMSRRTALIRSVLDFAQRLVRITLALCFASLTGAHLRDALLVVDERQNVFHHFFHPLRQQRQDASFARFYAHYEKPAAGTPAGDRYLLALSSIVMGQEPLIGAICAGLLNAPQRPLAEAVERYYPISYVARQCITASAIEGTAFTPGDVVYTGLLPASDETPPTTPFPFGIGVHICSGKPLAEAIIAIAENAYRRDFAGGFPHRPETRADGAFFSYRN